MKKALSILFAVVLASAIFSGCASTAKTPRSIKTTAYKIKNTKAAAEIAENYSIPVFYEKGSAFEWEKGVELKELYIAQNKENGEHVIYLDSIGANGLRIEFAELNINGAATSSIKIYTEYGPLVLNNTDELCELEGSGGAILDPQTYKEHTALLYDIKTQIIDLLAKTKHFKYKTAPVNPKQLEAIKSVRF